MRASRLGTARPPSCMLGLTLLVLGLVIVPFGLLAVLLRRSLVVVTGGFLVGFMAPPSSSWRLLPPDP